MGDHTNSRFHRPRFAGNFSVSGLTTAAGITVSRVKRSNCSFDSQTSKMCQKPKRSTLNALRRTILEVVPEAEQEISYRVPAFRVGGKTVAGFAALRDHLSYLPFRGSVLSQFCR